MNANGEYSVYLVDDDRMFLTSLKNTLKQKFGPLLKVTEYHTGEECLEHMYRFHPLDEQPDIVILDYSMKDENHPDAVNGIKILKRLKAISDEIVVIMLSGQEKLQIAVESLKNGAYEYIYKSESAFANTENSLKNAIEDINTARETKKYLKWNIYMGMLMIGLIMLDIIWYGIMH